MKERNLIKVIILVALVASSLQQNSEPPSKGKIAVTTYKTSNGKPPSLSEEVLINREGLKEEESTKYINGRMSHSYNLTNKKMEVTVLYYAKTKNSSVNHPHRCPKHKFKMSFQYYPNASYLNKTLLYTQNTTDESLYKLNVTDPEKRLQNKVEGCMNQIKIDAISLSIESYTKSYENETLVGFRPKLREIRLFEIKGKKITQFSLKELDLIRDKANSFIDFIFVILCYFVPCTLMFVWIFLISASARDLSTAELEELVKSQELDVAYFGSTLVQFSNSLAFLVWAVRLAPQNYSAIIFLILCLFLPLVYFHLVLVNLSAKTLKRCYGSLRSPHVFIAVSFTFLGWFGVCVTLRTFLRQDCLFASCCALIYSP